MTELSLADGFPAATYEQWQQLALGVLRKAGTAGADTPPESVDTLLSAETYEGIKVRPLYTAGTRTFPGTRTGAWDVRQRHTDPDPKATQEAVLADLENGATSIWLVIGEGGLDPAALPDVLDGVYLDLAGVALDAGAGTRDAAEAFLRLAPSQAAGSLGADPLGLRARTGEPAGLAVAADLAARCAAGFPGLRAVTVDATGYHEAGGSDAQELGCAVATGVAYLRALTDAGLGPAAALGQLEFRYAATADQFLTIAKLRAARRLWARVAEVCAAVGAQRQHAVTSAAMMTARDPWVNLLRGTLACFAAGVGGADAVTVLPFDTRLGLPDGLARRLARNTQSLLLEEANVARVADPAGGSWYVEQLTDDLARRAWDWFTEIERAGGMAAALDSGMVADRLAETWARRSDNIARRRDPITGVSEYPNLAEQLPVRAPAPQPAGGGLPRHRYAEAFETLRDRADARSGRPTVFLATLGPLAVHSGRAAFAANLFAAGGIATVRGGAGPDLDPAGVAAAFVASGASVACLCSSDGVYATAAGPVAAALKGAGARRVWLAGKPGGFADVDDYLYAGCDAVAVLDTTLRDLAVA